MRPGYWESNGSNMDFHIGVSGIYRELDFFYVVQPYADYPIREGNPSSLLYDSIDVGAELVDICIMACILLSSTLFPSI